MGQRLLFIHDALDEDLNLPAGVFPTEQTGSHDPGVIENEQIIGSEQPGQIGKEKVTPATGDAPLRRLEREESRRASIRQRALGNQLGGKVVPEIAEAHGREHLGESRLTKDQ
jgi:hypothetical protein